MQGRETMYCSSRPKGHAHLCRMTPFLFFIDIFVILASIYAFQVRTNQPVYVRALRASVCTLTTNLSPA